MTSPATISSREESRTLPVFTLVIWTSFFAVGVAGLLVRYGKPTPPAKSPPPVIAQTLVVELTDDPVPPITQPAPTTSLPEPPPLAPPIALPSMPPTIAVAAPSPSIAFAVPVQAPAKIVEPAQASYRATILTQRVESAPAPAPQPLTYGVGEGRQPAPEYPRLAMRLGQEGVVVVRLSVGADGRVVAAEASSPSPWPLLNEAALRVVRQRWRFSSGVARAYEVAIRFQLNRTNS